MNTVADVLCWLAALLQFAFAGLEMFKWRGMAVKVFKFSPEAANTSASIAAQIAAYNAALAMGLVLGQLSQDALMKFSFLAFMLCAASFGASSVKWTLLVSQGLVPALALLLLGSSGESHCGLDNDGKLPCYGALLVA